MSYSLLKDDAVVDGGSLQRHCGPAQSRHVIAKAGRGTKTDRARIMTVMHLIRTGDWLVLGAAAGLVLWLFIIAWHRPTAADVTIRAGGRVFLQTTLARNQLINVPGPLGTSVIEVANHRVRVARDPSPRQYCVRQGWLSQEGEAAICLPNQTSVELGGAKALYDSLAY